MSQDSTHAETARTMTLPTLTAMVIGSMVGVGDFFDYSWAPVLPGRIVRSVHLPAAPLVLDRAVTGGIPAYVARLLTDLLVSIDRRPSS
ncbi:hypothetical protein [Nonomuraea sp. NPDC049784]|uniref:hypothetical protein n=1 Tax=Nonomuraea sp. NPDC049784 TaxID=3154361 RepID=UPI0033DD815C